MTQHSPIQALVAELHADREALRAAVERVPPALRGQRPAPDRWSVAEVSEHLSIVEGRSTAIVADLAAKAPPLSGGGGASAGAASPSRPLAVDRALLRDRTRRVEAPEPIRPTGGCDAETAWAALERSRAALLAVLADAEGRDLAAVERPHPRLGPLNGYQWISATGGHEERHTMQIEEIGEELGRARA